MTDPAIPEDDIPTDGLPPETISEEPVDDYVGEPSAVEPEEGE